MEPKPQLTIQKPSQLAAFIDHTLLKPDTSEAQIKVLCQEAAENGFAAVCVYPRFVKLARTQLQGSPVKVAAVVGFPSGKESLDQKLLETLQATQDGADEIDMVMNYQALKNKDYALVLREISAVATATPLLKVILETSELSTEEKTIGCALAIAGGAKFVKTSTGFSKAGATVEDIRLMRKIVGEGPGVKASGGIRDFNTAKNMIEAGATRLGTSSGVNLVKGEAPKGSGY